MQNRKRGISLFCPKCGNQISHSVSWLEKEAMFACDACKAILEFDHNEFLRLEATAKSGPIHRKDYLVFRLVER